MYARPASQPSTSPSALSSLSSLSHSLSSCRSSVATRSAAFSAPSADESSLLVEPTRPALATPQEQCDAGESRHRESSTGGEDIIDETHHNSLAVIMTAAMLVEHSPNCLLSERVRLFLPSDSVHYWLQVVSQARRLSTLTALLEKPNRDLLVQAVALMNAYPQLRISNLVSFVERWDASWRDSDPTAILSAINM